MRDFFKETEEQLRNGTQRQMTHFTEEQLQRLFEEEEAAQKKEGYVPNEFLRLIKEGLIVNVPPSDLEKILPKELQKKWVKQVEKKLTKVQNIRMHMQKNPHDNWLEVHKKYGGETTLESLREEMQTQMEVFELLWKNRDFFTNGEFKNLPVKLFKNVDPQNNFGIASILADTMYHLIDLLRTELRNDYSNHWTAKGKIADSYNREISLEYSFQANSEEEARKILDEYEHLMKTKGIKVWMAYWKVANKQGRPEYTCPFIDILKCMSDENREAHFSTKEKQECWEITKILGRTTLKISRPVGKGRIRWVEQPMVDILGGEKDTVVEKYPLSVSVRVLSAQVASDDFAPIIYKNKTLQLNPGEALLAYALQTRAFRKKDGNVFDWDFAFKLGNVQKSAITNRRAAKAKIRKKLEHLQKADIIDSFSEDKNGIRTKPSKKNKGTT